MLSWFPGIYYQHSNNSASFPWKSLRIAREGLSSFCILLIFKFRSKIPWAVLKKKKTYILRLWQNTEEWFQEKESRVEQTQWESVRLWSFTVSHTNGIWKEVMKQMDSFITAFKKLRLFFSCRKLLSLLRFTGIKDLVFKMLLRL